MANEEHVAILRQGVDIWNKWIDEHPYGLGQVWGGDGVDMNITPVDLSSAKLSGIDLTGANLMLVNLRFADLSNAKLIHANLSGAYLFQANLHGADLSYAELLGIFMMPGADLGGADLSEAVLRNTSLRKAYLGKAKLRKAKLDEVDLYRVNLSGADLTASEIKNSDFRQADFSGSILLNAHLLDSHLYQTDLSHANLTNASLAGLTLINTRLTGTNFTNSSMGRMVLADTDFSKVIGLESVMHFAPSTIGIDTIYRSMNQIPESFLRGAGVPNDFIRYSSSMVGEPIEYYSCFISYSSRDEAFAERLYADLQNEGVRCWFAQEDMRIGDKMWDTIEDMIRRYDKLIIILSRHSLASNWVEREVEKALEVEQYRRSQGRTDVNVLFPIRLDETILDSKTAWASHIKRSRHIGDFTQWKNYDEYQRAFAHLLRDLRGGERSRITPQHD